mmetsp:Transcript_53875/g.125690  ORF Transcript_53875/g.125690 Transcript_53875/m.125690 type:complete len:117 (-) Transcript_53875:272-622(-)
MKLLQVWAFISLLPVAFAQEEEELDAPDGPPDFDELLTEIDQDKDGLVSWEEMFGGDEPPEDMEPMPADVKVKYQAAYKECDADGDGLINREELPVLFDKLTALEEAEEAEMKDEV